MNLINSRFGRKIGFAKSIGASLRQLVGGYREYETISWSEVRRLVFICQGNICRSAYADARAQALGLSAASAGLAAKSGGNADSHAAKIAAERNINLTTHRTTPVSELMMYPGDLYVCMEPTQAMAMQQGMHPGQRQQVTLLGLWADEQRPFLQDPYGLEYAYWNTCFDIIDSALQNIHRKIVSPDC